MDVSSGRKRSRAHSTATDELQLHPAAFPRWRLPVWVFLIFTLFCEIERFLSCFWALICFHILYVNKRGAGFAKVHRHFWPGPAFSRQMRQTTASCGYKPINAQHFGLSWCLIQVFTVYLQAYLLKTYVNPYVLPCHLGLAPNVLDRVEFWTLRDPVCHFQCSSRFPLLQVGRRMFIG